MKQGAGEGGQPEGRPARRRRRGRPIRRRWASLAAVGLLIGLPASAFFLATTHLGVRSAAAQAQAPGANLAGINSTASSAAIQIQPLTPGLVGAGNVVEGNLIQASVPFASSSSTTGPSNSGTATPVWPGSTASQLGTVFTNFAPLPQSMVSLLNDPVLAQSTYPSQVSIGTSGKYAPPGGSLIGVGTASTESSDSGTTATAAISDNSLLGATPSASLGKLGGLGSLLGNLTTGGPLFEIASSTASSSSTVGASTVAVSAQSNVGTIDLLGGLIQIGGLVSKASANSNGTVGSQSSSLDIGAVTVAGHSASIGPNGIQLNDAGQASTVVNLLNEVLAILQQAGLSVRTLAPVSQAVGNSASVTSGALQIDFTDDHLPDPNGLLPVNSIGLNIDLGLTQASAQATALPPIPSTSNTTPTTTATAPSSLRTAPPPPSSSTAASPGSSAQPGTYVPGNPGHLLTEQGSSAPPSTTGSGATPSYQERSEPTQITPASYLGLPVKVIWVVMAFILALVAAGPLLAYANWQLLRGRSP